MKIISRYILKEHVGPFTFALTALTSLMLLQVIARRFGDLVGKGLGWQVIARFFLLSVPYTVAMTLPMAVLVAVLYAFSRLAQDNEISALKAGGVSMRQLMVPVLWAAVATAAVMLYFNDQILPAANHELAVLQDDIFRTKPTFVLREQVINTVKEGQLYLRAGHLVQGSSRMRDVVIYDLNDPTRRRTIYADSGTLSLAANHRDLSMHLFHGEMQTEETQHPGQLTRLYYKEDELQVPGVASGFNPTNPDTATKSDREMSVCEMDAALMRQTAILEQADFTMRMAQFDAKQSKGVKATRPVLKAPKKPFGVGGLYCALVRMITVKSLHAEEVPFAFQGRQAQSATAQKNALVPPPAQQIPQVQAQEVTPGRASTPPAMAPSAGMQPVTPIDVELRITQARLQLQEAEHLVERYSVEIHKKFSLAASCIIFVLIGAPVALRFPRGGVGLVIGVSFSIFAIYYVCLIAGESLADNLYLSPFWAMWSANLFMLLIGVVLLARMGREGSTARGGDFADMRGAFIGWIRRIVRREERSGAAAEQRRFA